LTSWGSAIKNSLLLVWVYALLPGIAAVYVFLEGQKMFNTQADNWNNNRASFSQSEYTLGFLLMIMSLGIFATLFLAGLLKAISDAIEEGIVSIE
jgi:hypothetical protein